ncbi:hypothetical protein M5X17_27500 [Paenibacillus alvei]|uniref:hypothetical protein n=1 Tax=Paenibacillus alvei TaxID=44250 RepID=UPI00227DD090|nr:hypothetical protein [Paenibacillus alvei]MCY9737451.1 hypothetical protein [Paenibacillus alvei]
MAYLSASSSGSGSIRWTVGGLQQSVSLYSFSLSTSDGKVGNGWNGGSSTTSYGHSCGRTISGTVSIYFKGSYQGSVSASTYTYDCPVPPSGTPYVSCSASGLYISVSWSSVSGATSYDVYANGGSGDYWKDTTSSTYTSFSVDREYTNYTIKVIPRNSYGTGGTGYGYCKTPDLTPPSVYTPTLVDVSQRWLKVRVSGYDSMSGIERFYFYLYDSNKSQINTASSYASSSSAECTFTGLTPERIYYVTAKAVDRDGNSSTMSSYSSAIKTLSDRPPLFSWSVTIERGHNASNITASEWSRFTRAINDLRKFKNLGEYPFSWAGSGSYFLATQFNEAIDAIASMTSGLPSRKSKGDIMLASDFHLLVSRLNSIN